METKKTIEAVSTIRKLPCVALAVRYETKEGYKGYEMVGAYLDDCVEHVRFLNEHTETKADLVRVFVNKSGMVEAI